MFDAKNNRMLDSMYFRFLLTTGGLFGVVWRRLLAAFALTTRESDARKADGGIHT